MEQHEAPTEQHAAELTRPSAVPAEAVWHPDLQRWELADASPDGTKQGEFRMWREDGTLYMQGRYSAGQPSGLFRLFHPNGQVAREGRYVDGELDGEVIAWASDAPSPEMLRGCCVPDGAWQMRARYARGELHEEVFYDRQQRRLLSDGTPFPERPATIPEAAELEEWTRRWVVVEGAPEATRRRYWREGGGLDEDAEYQGTAKVRSVLYDGAGVVREEAHFTSDGAKHGRWHKRYLVTGESPFRDERIAEVEGEFEGGREVGEWTFRDVSGAVVKRVNRGILPTADAEVFTSGDPAVDWAARARVLLREGRTREALCAAARASAGDGSVTALRRVLDEVTVPLTAAESDRVMAACAEATDGLAAGLDALSGGADPAAALRAVASTVSDGPGAALALADAAILLAPERPMLRVTRALARLELGDFDGALTDAQAAAAVSPETEEFIRDYVRLLRPRFDFWPGREVADSVLPDMPEAPAQPLPAMRRMIQVYATRLARVRAVLVDRLQAQPSWLPPDTSALLPDGPLQLEPYEAEIIDETEEGTEATTVQVDERLVLDGARWKVPALMRLARSQWMALTWLCWCAGLDEVGLPERLSPPANFPQAAGVAIARYWRAMDGITTGGMRAMTAGVPGFQWEGMEIESMPSLFVEMARDEYLEMRSVFLWLSSADNLSTFQSDLRAA